MDNQSPYDDCPIPGIGRIRGHMQAPAVLSCQYASWYRQLGHLAFKSKLIEVPQNFIDFLLQDGVFLSESSSAVSISLRMILISLRIQ